MSSLAPVATYHAELREQLEGVGRVLALQRAATWALRGLMVGLALTLLWIGWLWWREQVRVMAPFLFVLPPLALAGAAGTAALFVKTTPQALARRIDHVAGLQERSLTALELGARADETRLTVVQMRDAVEHLRRVEPLEVFPMRAPRAELVVSALVVLVGAAFYFAPNPWAVNARAANPATAVARDQAQRVDRLAASLQQENPEIQQLRDVLQRGARTVDTRSSEPESALNALEDLEEQIRQMGLGDDQLAAALAAISSALAGEEGTAGLAAAINTGDMREIARAARDLGQQAETMSGQDRERVARALRDASDRASRASPATAGQLGDAAEALAGGGEGQEAVAGQEGQAGQRSGSTRGGQQGTGRSAQEAMGDLANSAEAAAERQRAQSQLEGSRNALERALGRSQSRSGPSSARSQANTQRNRAGTAGANGEGQEGQSGAGQGENGEGGQDGEGGSQGQGGEGENPGQNGSGAGTGTLNQTGPGTQIDTITRPEMVGGESFTPDETTSNPYLGEAGDGDVTAGEESVNATFARRTTQAGDGANIPLGLRDLVKDYFSAIDQK